MTTPTTPYAQSPKKADPVLARLWQYQAERFPVFRNGLLILVFSASAVSYSAVLRGAETLPGIGKFAAAFIVAFIAFFHLRLADEHKDREDDSRYRPELPVPRGLVTLCELRLVGVLLGIAQIVACQFLDPLLLGFLLLIWGYQGLMSCEFFVRDWLRARPVHYLWTHMLVMPLIDLFATACDWVPANTYKPGGLLLFVLVSFLNGMVIETGRKIRAPEQEREGVDTYTRVWGLRRAVWIWASLMSATCVLAVVVLWQLALPWPALPLLGLLGFSVSRAGRFADSPASKRAAGIENLSGYWTLLLYLSLGIVPLGVTLLLG